MPTRIEIEDVKSIFDNIIPGNRDGWPAFNSINNGITHLIHEKYINVISEIHNNYQINSSVGEAISSAERDNPNAFAALYRDLCDAYYSAPEVVETVARLAETGPKEASPQFDGSLIDKVVATQAGRGRY